MPAMPHSSPSAPPKLDEDTVDDILYSARAGDLQSLKSDLAAAADTLSAPQSSILIAAVDETTGNSCTHYAAANGHLDILQYITTTPDANLALSESLFATQNLAGNTPLHYAALNGHLPAVKFLVESAPSEARTNFISCKNQAGHDAAFEAEGNNKEDVVAYLLGALDGADGKDSVGSAKHQHEDDDFTGGVTNDSMNGPEKEDGIRNVDPKQELEEIEESFRQAELEDGQDGNR